MRSRRPEGREISVCNIDSRNGDMYQDQPISQVALLWSTLLLYVLGRLCQFYANRLPTLLIVILHVIPPAIFAIVHGSILYRLKGISIFAAFCLGFGGLAEIISLRTGFPFGHHYFTDAMGPQVLHVPVLLVLAYLAIGYVFWVLAQLGSWAQTRVRELDYLRLADAPGIVSGRSDGSSRSGPNESRPAHVRYRSISWSRSRSRP